MRRGKNEKKKLRSVLSDICLAMLALALCWLLLDGRNTPLNEEKQVSYSLTERKAQAAEVYHACADKLRDALPGIVCWGDEAAVGNGEGSLAGKLYRWANEALLTDLEDAFAFQTNFYNILDLKIRVKNMGVGNEGMSELLVRCGAKSLLLAEDYSIPVYGYMSNVRLMDEDGHELHFAEQKFAKFDRTVIGGVQGYLYIGTGSYDKTHPMLAYAREFQGQSITLPKGSKVETESAAAYRQYLPILFFQTTLGQTEETFIQALTSILNFHQNPGGYYVVIVCTEEHTTLDDALTDAFGPRYIRAEKSASEMRKTDYSRLAEKVYACIDSQGGFDAVREAVQAAMVRLGEINSL
ncbi:MAG: hypothetical protein IKN04_21880 [Clostridia bacterium]|nr:hypothetical protein [Clostridia bacterium]MBR6186812.1 hypothetical protein [Clostridia bacterium]